MAEPLTLIRVCDVETTGIDDPAEMVELGWTDVRLFPDGWAVERGPESVLVNPGMPISFPAMAVHHISDAMVRQAADPDDLRKEIVKGVDYLCAHNAAFDSRFIRGHNVPWLCTFKGARTAWPEMQSHGNGSIRYERGLLLDDKRCEPSHRAGPDTWVTAHILLDLLKIYEPETLAEISRKPVLLRKIPFGQHFGKSFREIDNGWLNWAVDKMSDDPTKEDVVFTAKTELSRRQQAASIEAPSAGDPDPDFWRRDVGAF